MVDLLVAMTIIAVLAAITFGALGAARQSSRADSTRQTIEKLHAILMAKYDSYRTRRIPMDLRAYIAAHDGNPATSYGYAEGDDYGYQLNNQYPRHVARAKVNAIRDLIRMEMPDRWSDIVNVGSPNVPNSVCLVLPTAPSLTHRYRRIYKNSKAYTDPKDQWGAAECLYMVVMAIPGAAEQFHDSEMGDTDGDGLPKFHDAWGRPIRFLRWPSGCYSDPGGDFHGDSDLQFGPDTLTTGTNPKYQADPFDPQHAIPTQESFALYPFIYSAGPDGEFDINIGKTNSGATTDAYELDGDGNLDPFAADGDGHYVGQPLNNDDADRLYEDLRHYDNVHNQRKE